MAGPDAGALNTKHCVGMHDAQNDIASHCFSVLCAWHWARDLPKVFFPSPYAIMPTGSSWKHTGLPVLVVVLVVVVRVVAVSGVDVVVVVEVVEALGVVALVSVVVVVVVVVVAVVGVVVAVAVAVAVAVFVFVVEVVVVGVVVDVTVTVVVVVVMDVVVKQTPSPCWQLGRSAFVGHTPVVACLIMIQNRVPLSPPRSHCSLHGLAKYMQSV